MTLNIITKVELKDKDDFNRALDQYIDKFNDEVAKALYAECQVIMGESVKQCPIDEGTLRRSRKVHMPEHDWDGVYVDMTYGTRYAIYVHENLEANHRPPTKAKFLEDPARAHMPHMVENVVKRVNRRLGE